MSNSSVVTSPATVCETVLSDGSSVYAVKMHTNTNVTITLDCFSQVDADRLAGALCASVSSIMLDFE